MDGVVHTEPHCQDYVDAGDDVDGDVPEVEESDDVGETEGDHEDDHEADLYVTEEEEGDEDHAGDGEAEVPPEFSPNDDICLPAGVDLDMAEVVGRGCLLYDPPDCLPGWNMLLRCGQSHVGQTEL